MVENKRILDLPLNGRNIYQLAALVPGVFFVRQTTGVDDTFTANRFVVNGGQESTSDIVLDGVTATVSHNIVNIPAVSAIPSVEGIQEFRIQTNAFAAEYGRSGGGLVTLVTKSGTNHIHGSVYEFFRNSKLDANNFFTNRAGVKLASFKRNQFGGSFGGPIYLPKVYNGKNKTFFFSDYEGQRRRRSSTAQHTVPTDLERRGDFSQTYTVAGVVRPVYDPFTTRPDPARPGNFVRDPFPGNVVPGSLMSPIALKSMSYYPAPNAAGLPFTHQNNLVLQDAYPEPQDRIEFKVDHNFNDRRRMFGRYTFMDSVYSKPNFWKNVADPGCCDPMNQRLQNAALDYTENFGSTMVLNLRYGLGRVSGNRVPWSSTFDPQNGFKVATLGLPSYIDAVSDHQVFPTITIQDMTQLGPNSGDIYFMGDTTHSFIATVSRVAGRHSMKYGFDFRLNYVNYGQLGTPSGTFGFTRTMTQGPDPRTAGNSGVGFASFLLGAGSGSVTHQIRPANANHYAAFYIQDDFKVTSKLTLNIGFRWDFESGDTERYDRMTAIDPFAKNPIADQVKMDLRGIALFAGKSLGSRSIRNTDLKQWNPRFGLAYQMNSKTVIRSGYGIFFGLPSYSANSGYTGGAFSGSTSWLSTEPDGVTPKYSWSDPFPTGWTLPLGSNAGPNGLLGRSLGGGLAGVADAHVQPAVEFHDPEKRGQRHGLGDCLRGQQGHPSFLRLPVQPNESRAPEHGKRPERHGAKSVLRHHRSGSVAGSADGAARQSAQAVPAILRCFGQQRRVCEQQLSCVANAIREAVLQRLELPGGVHVLEDDHGRIRWPLEPRRWRPGQLLPLVRARGVFLRSAAPGDHEHHLRTAVRARQSSGRELEPRHQRRVRRMAGERDTDALSGPSPLQLGRLDEHLLLFRRIAAARHHRSQPETGSSDNRPVVRYEPIQAAGEFHFWKPGPHSLVGPRGPRARSGLFGLQELPSA